MVRAANPTFTLSNIAKKYNNIRKGINRFLIFFTVFNSNEVVFPIDVAMFNHSSIFENRKVKKINEFSEKTFYSFRHKINLLWEVLFLKRILPQLIFYLKIFL
jgi:hypothetical protein